MKKILLTSITFAFVLVSMFSVSPIIKTAQAQSMSVSQLVELLIVIGVIAPDNAVAARAAVATLSTTTPAIVTPTFAPIVPTDVISTSTSYIQVLSPNTAVSWEIDLDLAYEIKWGSSGLTQAHVALVPTKGPVCNLTSAPVSSKNGDHTFKTLLKTAKCYNLNTGTSTPLTDGSYKVRVYYTDSVGTTLKDDSDVAFKILPIAIPSIKVTYPNGKESLVRNTEYDVKYKLTNVTNVVNNFIYLYLLDSNGNIAYNSHKIKRSDGTYSLDLPSSLSAGAYKVKLKTTTSPDKVEIEDISDDFFWISTGL